MRSQNHVSIEATMRRLNKLADEYRQIELVWRSLETAIMPPPGSGRRSASRGGSNFTNWS